MARRVGDGRARGGVRRSKRLFRSGAFASERRRRENASHVRHRWTTKRRIHRVYDSRDGRGRRRERGRTVRIDAATRVSRERADVVETLARASRRPRRLGERRVRPAHRVRVFHGGHACGRTVGRRGLQRALRVRRARMARALYLIAPRRETRRDSRVGARKSCARG